ncbi:hemerythrin HHE cation binding domain-containing protein [Halopolyspora algeriensis]|uniref:Hemerythrin HHE cation binding domain-containing protein n=1 Tax=Halopolyspora algeriensis TaxID=1500506 RepID=A0A368VSE3_9ACTN|nr:hemerythrin domain-containing protein [Halopolyspora algeriensis]RCW44595.1 hemerythrin HHE cation binding domain-containing protein [Halopolyspora algeriensis]TQM55956.1 hemerythrin HHE cation binding domain-containing protein [Halopolyspora algeriensis]
MSEATRQRDMIGMLIDDHRSVEEAFQQFESGGLTPEQRRNLIDHIITELVRHSVAEEQYLYPTARETLPDGNEIADHEISEHAEAERTMKQLESLDPHDEQFTNTANELISSIRHHVQDEENDLFPKLRQSCSSERLEELGGKIQQAKETAPTRPHPSSPTKPPMNKILDPGAGLVDRARDALTGRSH